MYNKQKRKSKYKQNSNLNLAFNSNPSCITDYVWLGLSREAEEQQVLKKKKKQLYNEDMFMPIDRFKTLLLHRLRKEIHFTKC